MPRLDELACLEWVATQEPVKRSTIDWLYRWLKATGQKPERAEAKACLERVRRMLRDETNDYHHLSLIVLPTRQSTRYDGEVVSSVEPEPEFAESTALAPVRDALHQNGFVLDRSAAVIADGNVKMEKESKRAQSIYASSTAAWAEEQKFRDLKFENETLRRQLVERENADLRAQLQRRLDHD